MLAKLRKKAPWFSVLTIADWIVCAVLLLLCLLFEQMDPYHAYLPDSSDNPMTDYPYKVSTVSSILAFLLSFGFPIIIFVLMNIFYKLLIKKWDVAHDLYNAMLGLVECGAFMLLITESLKPFAGRYRPHYINRTFLHPDEEQDGRKSFPSGHSSTAFCGLGYAALYLCGKLQLFNGHGGQAYRAIIVGIPLYSAALIAVSRARDYHHNWSDIIAGSIIGFACALVGYFFNFPSLANQYCYVPSNKRDPDTIPTTIFSSSRRIDVEEGKPPQQPTNANELQSPNSRIVTPLLDSQ